MTLRQRGKLSPRRTVRINDGKFQTAVHEYEGRDGRSITLVGNAHIGEERYFSLLFDIVEKHRANGARVQYERIRDLDDDRAARNDAERDALKTMRQWLRATGKLVDVLGLPWVPIHSVFPLKESWSNVDFTAIDVVRMLGTDLFSTAPLITGPIERLRKAEKASDKERASMRRKLLLAMRIRAWLGGVATTGNAAVNLVVRDARNLLAANDVLADEGDVVALWGTGHLPGIGAILHRNGFELTNVDWVSAFSLRPTLVDNLAPIG